MTTGEEDEPCWSYGATYGAVEGASTNRPWQDAAKRKFKDKKMSVSLQLNRPECESYSGKKKKTTLKKKKTLETKQKKKKTKQEAKARGLGGPKQPTAQRPRSGPGAPPPAGGHAPPPPGFAQFQRRQRQRRLPILQSEAGVVAVGGSYRARVRRGSGAVGRTRLSSLRPAGRL